MPNRGQEGPPRRWESRRRRWMLCSELSCARNRLAAVVRHRAEVSGITKKIKNVAVARDVGDESTMATAVLLRASGSGAKQRIFRPCSAAASG